MYTIHAMVSTIQAQGNFDFSQVDTRGSPIKRESPLHKGYPVPLCASLLSHVILLVWQPLPQFIFTELDLDRHTVSGRHAPQAHTHTHTHTHRHAHRRTQTCGLGCSTVAAERRSEDNLVHSSTQYKARVHAPSLYPLPSYWHMNNTCYVWPVSMILLIHGVARLQRSMCAKCAHICAPHLRPWDRRTDCPLPTSCLDTQQTRWERHLRVHNTMWFSQVVPKAEPRYSELTCKGERCYCEDGGSQWTVRSTGRGRYRSSCQERYKQKPAPGHYSPTGVYHVQSAAIFTNGIGSGHI